MSSTQWYNGSLSCSPVGRTTLITSLLTNSSVQSTQMARVCISTFWIPIKQKLLIVFVIIRNKIRTHSYSYWKSHSLWVSRSQITTHFGITRCEYHLFLWLIWLLSMRGGGNRPDGNNSWWSTHNIQSKIHTLRAQMYVWCCTHTAYSIVGYCRHVKPPVGAGRTYSLILSVPLTWLSNIIIMIKI